MLFRKQKCLPLSATSTQVSNLQAKLFRVGATFEMRTVPYRIHLLIDNIIMHDKVYIQNQTEWGESKTAERLIKREAEHR